MLCAKCGTENPGSGKFCTQCAAPLSTSCPSCGEACPAGARFCGNCGTALGPRTSGPAAAERRQLTVLFSDLVGSTALSADLDPEDLRELIGAYQSCCGEVIRSRDGHIAQYLGDGILVYFGYPNAHEDDAQRAVRSALEMVTAVAAVEVAGHNPQIRIGIHTGLVVVGEVGSGGRREELALGETPNVAARVQSEAAPGTVVISEATQRLVRGFFDFTEVETRRLKGLSREIRLFRVERESGARGRLEAAGESGLTPFVGRQREIGLLEECWAQARKGVGQVVQLNGEAGIGKSRLIEMMRQQARESEAAILQGFCSPYSRGSALQPMVEMLEREIGAAVDDTSNQRYGKLEGWVETLPLTAPETTPLLAELLTIQADGNYQPVEAPPRAKRAQTLRTLTDVLLAIAAARPALLVVEDLHWADPSTIEFISLLTERMGGAAMLSLLTFRPEFRSTLQGPNDIHELTLDRLPREQTEAMVRRVAGSKRLPKPVMELLVDRTGGVPLFVEEVTKAVLEAGVLVEGEKSYELVGEVPDGLVPATVHDSLMARLDRLGDSKRTAQLAATLGREFRFEMLEAVSDLTGPSLEQDLARLVDGELVFQDGRPPQAVYIFKHALIQDAAYQSLLRTTRQSYHRKIGEMLEERFPEIAKTQPEVLARHFTAGRVPESAIQFWLEAGKQNLERSANLEAISHLTSGQRVLKEHPGIPDALQHDLALQLNLGPALMAIKGYSAPEVERAYSRARELCAELGDTPQLFPVLWGLFAYYFVGGSLKTARELGEQIVRLADAADDPSLQAPARHALGFPLCYQADYRGALEQAETGIRFFEREREQDNVLKFQFSSTTALHRFAGTALLMLGYPDQARQQAAKALSLARELRHRPSLAFALTSSAWFHQLTRDAEQIRGVIDEVTQISEAEEFSFWPPLGRVFDGWALMELGDVKAGVRQMQDSLAAYQAIGGGILRTHAHALIAEGLWRSGKLEEALEVIERGLGTIHESHEFHFQPELHRVRGEILLDLADASGDTRDVAERNIERAVELARHQGTRWLELRAVVSQCRLLRRQGSSERAREALGEVYSWFTEGFDTADLIAAKQLLEQLRG